MTIYTRESAAPEQLSNWAKHAYKPMADPELEKHCEFCLGYGLWGADHIDGTVHWNTCTECDGMGLIPSERGEAVLEFIEKHIRPMVRGLI